MITQNNEAHPFWSGFTVGAIIGTGLMYLIGTKKGRENALRVLENTEDFENSLHQILNFLRTNDIIETLTNEEHGENKLNTIIDKMTHLGSVENSKQKS